MVFTYVAACFFLACQNSDPNHEATNKKLTGEAIETKPAQASLLPPQKQSIEWLVVPGTQLGKLQIGTNAQSLAALLGPPAESDAAMGKAWLTWTGKGGTQLNVYTAYKDTSMREQTVQLIRCTSPMFRTENGLGVQSSLQQFSKAFPSLLPIGSYKKSSGQIVRLYEVPNEGFGLETTDIGNEKTCTAMMVYSKRDSLMKAYRSFVNAQGWVEQ